MAASDLRYSVSSLTSDLDALYYINLFGDSSSNVAINLESYYNNYSYNRYANFVDGRTKADFVDDVYFYTRNKFTKLGVEVIQWPLYDDSHIITDVQAQAAADAFTDYIWTLL